MEMSWWEPGQCDLVDLCDAQLQTRVCALISRLHKIPALKFDTFFQKLKTIPVVLFPHQQSGAHGCFLVFGMKVLNKLSDTPTQSSTQPKANVKTQTVTQLCHTGQTQYQKRVAKELLRASNLFACDGPQP